MKRALWRWTFPAMVVAVVPTAACHAAPVAGQVATSTMSVVSSARAGGSAEESAADDAAAACRTWAAAAQQSAAQGSVGLKTAARQAASAQDRDPQWRILADDMAFVSSLPETDNTNADIQRAQGAQREIAGTCGQLGVAIPG